MKVVIAIDSFKGSLSTNEASSAVASGIRKVYENAEIITLPLADGGEGTVNAIVQGTHSCLHKVSVCGPLGEKVDAEYGIMSDGKTAIVEMASSSGLTLVPPEKRNPLFTTTYGVGEVIKDAIAKGCRSFIVGIGGSATNDGGAGMLQALGFGLYDKDGNSIALGARGLESLEKIDTSDAISELGECTFNIACDVTNPLCGANGASAVFGPQKGATPETVKSLDKWLSNFAELTEKKLGKNFASIPGTGASGGLGFAFVAYLGATLRSGIDIVTEAVGLEECVKNADIVITGEGRVDAQTAMGKAPAGVAKIAKKYGKTVIALAGSVAKDAYECNSHGIDSIFPIVKSPCTLEDAMNADTAKANLSDTAEQIFRLIKAVK